MKQIFTTSKSCLGRSGGGGGGVVLPYLLFSSLELGDAFLEEAILSSLSMRP